MQYVITIHLIFKRYTKITIIQYFLLLIQSKYELIFFSSRFSLSFYSISTVLT